MNDSKYRFSVSVKRSNIVDIKPPVQRWAQLTSIARFKWRKLTTKELEGTKGIRQKLIDLVIGHYSIDQTEAERQVEDFLSSNNISIAIKSIIFHPGH